MKKYFAGLLLSLMMAISLTPIAHAAGKLTFSTTIQLPATGQMAEVDHEIRIEAGGEVELKLPVSGVQDAVLKPKDDDSARQVKTAEADITYRGVPLATTSFSFSAESGERLLLSYKTDKTMLSYGSNSAFIWSAYADGGGQISLSAVVPGKLGRPSIFGLPSSDSSFESGSLTFGFDMSKADKSIKLFFGGNALWQLDWSSTTLKNSSWWFQKRYVVLPPDTNQQRVWLESVSPKPHRLSVDRDGNLVAEYRLWPKRSITLSAKSFVDVRALLYNTSNSRPLADVPEELRDYTSRDSAKGLTQDTKVLAQVKRFYNQAVETAREREGDEQRITSDGQQIIVELSDNLRRSGIPTREVSGVALASREQIFAAHRPASWLEVYVPGIGWMTIDPLTEQYGQADPLHIGLVIFGAPSSTPLGAQLEGLTVQPYDQKSLPTAQLNSTQVSMTRYVLVPGLSLNRTQVSMPAGIVLDNAATTTDNNQMAFGSLASLQRIGRWSVSLGGESLRGGNLQFGRGGEYGLGEVLTSGPVHTNYLPIVLEVGLLLFGVWWLLRRRHRRSGGNGKVPSLEKQLADDTIATDDLLRKS